MNDRILARVRDFVIENYLYTRENAELSIDEPLVGTGVIDSMGILELIEFLQEEFGIAVRDDEITEENLGSLQAITRLVESKADGRAETALTA